MTQSADMQTTEILLFRHGETAWNAVQRLQGHIDIPLNEKGEQQAAAVAQSLQAESLQAIIASDLRRAAQTAQAIARRQNLTLQTDAGLRERCYGAFEGLRYSEIGQHYPQAFAAWQAREVDAIFPPGERIAESLRQFQARCVASILRWAKQHPGQKIAIVAHGGVLECAYRAALSKPLNAARDFPIANASINRFRVANGKLTLLTWGERKHLEKPVQAAPAELDRRVP